MRTPHQPQEPSVRDVCEARTQSPCQGLAYVLGVWRGHLMGLLKHGLCAHPLYRVWTDMRRRCYAIHRVEKYNAYGGRGIRVCLQWRTSFKSFYRWAIENGWQRGLQIDRIDNDGDYEPRNCRIVDRFVNSNNKRNNRPVTAFGETKNLAEWARDSRCRVKLITLARRLRVGEDAETAISRPARKWVRKLAHAD